MNVPTKSGYTFDGWYTANTGGEKVTVIESSVTGNLDLYARWTENKTDDSENNGTVCMETVSGKPGTIVKVPVTLENNPGIIAAQFKVKYDNTKLKLVEVIDGGILDSPVFNTSYTQKLYTISWGDGMLTENITATGKLQPFVLKFWKAVRQEVWK